MTISDKLKRFGRSLYSAPLNYPLSFQLKNPPQNTFLRAVKAMVYSFREKGYKEAYFIGKDKKYWLPSTGADLRDLNSASKGFAQGVACIYAPK